DIAARSNPAQRGRGPALGKANDPRKAVAAQGAAVRAGNALDLRQIREAAGEVPAGGGRGGGAGAAAGGGRGRGAARGDGGPTGAVGDGQPDEAALARGGVASRDT